MPNSRLPLSTHIRCAVEALPFEAPTLSAVAVSARSRADFASALEACIARSGNVKLIEAKALPQV